MLAFLALLLAAATVASAQPTTAEAPFVRRGMEVEARSDRLADEVSRLREVLEPLVARDAPELLGSLQATQTARRACAPGELPRLVPAAPPPARRPLPQSSRYSWPWTDQKIGAAEMQLASLRRSLDAAAAGEAAARREALAAIVAEYSKLVDAQRNIVEHLRYNRLWQADIAARRPYYDRMTRLHDIVADPSRRPGEDGRDGTTAPEVRAELDRIAVPAWVTVHESGPRRWIVRVRISTDITNETFVDSFERIVEQAWLVRDVESEFAVDVEIARDGFGGAGPTVAARLTTGADSTHAEHGTIRLGCGDLDERALAHELGHLLGLRDEYFRGYRDLGEDGFEVMEIVAEPQRLMGNPKDGVVTRVDFERLLRAISRRAPVAAAARPQ